NSRHVNEEIIEHARQNEKPVLDYPQTFEEYANKKNGISFHA
ncbi:hypothetical protein EZS27_023271, partial [termite gut metagenome]